MNPPSPSRENGGWGGEKHLDTWVIFRILHICIREHDVLHYGNRKVATQQR
jgi:hypothetical protein